MCFFLPRIPQISHRTLWILQSWDSVEEPQGSCEATWALMGEERTLGVASTLGDIIYAYWDNFSCVRIASRRIGVASEPVE